MTDAVESQIRQRIDKHAAYAATHVATKATFTDAGLMAMSDRDVMLLVLHELVAIRRQLASR